jgi:hypothetical protein
MSFCSNAAKNKLAKPSVQRMHRRNAIEGTWSELARGHGMRRSRYRGFGKVELQNLLIGTACNMAFGEQRNVMPSSALRS